MNENKYISKYEKEHIILGYENVRLFELLREWQKEVQPNDRAYLGAMSFLEYIIK